MTDIFSKSRTEVLKGYSALLVLLAHLCSRTGIGSQWGFGPIYTGMAYLSVGFFFFISGFGVMTSRNNREGYFSTFFKNRIVPTYALSLFFIGLYWLVELVFMPSLLVPESILLSFFFGRTIVINGWYLQVLLIMYLLFFFAGKIRTSFCPVMVTIGCVVYIVIAASVGLPSTWYETVLCFPVGLFMAGRTEKVSSVSTIGSVLLVLLFLCSFVLGNGPFLKIAAIKLTLKMVSALVYPVLLLIVTRFIPWNNAFGKWLSQYYLEIYLVQGVLFLLLRNRFWESSAWLFFIGGLLGTLCLARIFHPMIRWYINIFKSKV